MIALLAPEFDFCYLFQFLKSWFAICSMRSLMLVESLGLLELPSDNSSRGVQKETSWEGSEEGGRSR